MKQLIALFSSFVIIAGVKAQSGAVVAPINPQNRTAAVITYNGAVVAPLNPQNLTVTPIPNEEAVQAPINPQVAPGVPVTVPKSAITTIPSPVNLLARP